MKYKVYEANDVAEGTELVGVLESAFDANLLADALNKRYETINFEVREESE